MLYYQFVIQWLSGSQTFFMLTAVAPSSGVRGDATPLKIFTRGQPSIQQVNLLGYKLSLICYFVTQAHYFNTVHKLKSRYKIICNFQKLLGLLPLLIQIGDNQFAALAMQIITSPKRDVTVSLTKKF